MGAGPGDAPYVDAALADAGRTVWAGECINCHGTQARGTANGPNLTRSLVVLRDRYGSELGPFLKRGHKMQSGGAATTLTDGQIVNLSHFLRQRVNDSFRGSPIFQAQNVLTGDAKAGAVFFNGQGKCATCHVPPTFTEPGWNLHTAQEIGIDDFQASRSPDDRYRTTPLAGRLFSRTRGFYHDGRFATLLDVVNHYDGLRKLGLSAQQKQDLVEYLKSL